MRMYCSSCGVTWKKKHANDCDKTLRQWSKLGVYPAVNQQHLTKQVSKVKPPEPAIKPLVNYITIILDASGSMGAITEKVKKAFWDQITTIKQKAYETKQKTYVSVITFNAKVKTLWTNANPEQILPLNYDTYYPNGNTALLDAVGSAVTNASLGKSDEDSSWLIMVLTDGEENSSQGWNQYNIAEMIKTRQATERWTFAFLCPPSGVNYLTRFGIPIGNIQPWEQHEIVETGYQMSVGTQAYYGARSAGYNNVGTGKAASLSMFSPDLSSLTSKDFNNLTDVSKSFHSWMIDKEVDISQFVNNALGRSATLSKKVGNIYKIGSAYYQLTKPEIVQGHKDILIKDDKGRVFAGRDARRILGLPEGGGIKVKPGNMATFKIFVASTSMNRKLVRGTELLYRIW